MKLFVGGLALALAVNIYLNEITEGKIPHAAGFITMFATGVAAYCLLS